MLSILSSFFPKPLGTSSSTRVKFYERFQFESNGCDREFMKKYGEDLNTTLIFVRILFACTLVAIFIWFSSGGQLVGTYLLLEEETTRTKILCFRLRQVRCIQYIWWKHLGDRIELLMASPDQPSPLFNRETARKGLGGKSFVDVSYGGIAGRLPIETSRSQTIRHSYSRHRSVTLIHLRFCFIVNYPPQTGSFETRRLPLKTATQI